VIAVLLEFVIVTAVLLRYVFVIAVLLTFVIVTAILVRCDRDSCFTEICDRDSCLTDICDRDRRFICEYGHENSQSYVANQQTYCGIACLSYIINEVPICNILSTDTRVVEFRTSATSCSLCFIERNSIIPVVQDETYYFMCFIAAIKFYVSYYCS